MKLRPRVQAFLIVTLLGAVLYASLLGARLIEYSFALHNAVQEGDTTVVRLLLMAGVDPNLPDRATGMTPLDWAAEGGDLKIAQILLSANADPDGSRELFRRPLFHAAYRQDREIADLLLEHGAYYEVIDAVFLYDTEFVERALVEEPNVLQDVDYYGGSLLFLAMEFNRLDTARYLLELGLDPAEVARGGRDSALERARKWGRQDFVELFESYQSEPEPEPETGESP